MYGDFEVIRPKTGSGKEILLIRFPQKIDMKASDDLLFVVGTMVEGGLRKVIFDLASLEYIDSTGIGYFIKIEKILRAKDGVLAIAAMRQSIANVFELIGMEKITKVISTVEEAISLVRL